MKNYGVLPEHMRAGLRNYLERGIEPGSFLRCVLENDFQGALSRADEINRVGIFAIVGWLRAQAPEAAWGSRAKVSAWLEHFKQ